MQSTHTNTIYIAILNGLHRPTTVTIKKSTATFTIQTLQGWCPLPPRGLAVAPVPAS